VPDRDRRCQARCSGEDFFDVPHRPKPPFPLSFGNDLFLVLQGTDHTRNSNLVWVAKPNDGFDDYTEDTATLTIAGVGGKS
jgi:hypothetical protein